MLPPHLLEPRPGQWVLDMNAAPGGKTTHLAALAEGRARIAAMDQRAQKLEWVLENVERLGIEGVAVLCGDGRRAPFRSGFDRVLVDAPCSGFGTLRRHPDLKWRLAPQDLEELAGIQRELLRSAVDLCKNGGLIVYSVCTFSRPETEGVAEAILKDGRVTPEDGPDWLERWKISWGQYRILPRKDGMDGFFLMRLRKAS
jgi:16S rRNA (cytosine967-C5)-methyltransferase